jgi:C1A family cysteine protease
MSEKLKKLSMGWLPDYPDFRDCTINHDVVSEKLLKLGEKDSIKKMLKKTEGENPAKKESKSPVSLQEWFSPVEDQGSLGSCTANAGVALVEYFERRAFKKHIDASRLFLYKVARNLMHETGDNGAFLRSTMGALVLFGVPPEEFWPYIVSDFDKEPTAFCYAFAQNYQAITYYRLDPPGISKENLLSQIKKNIDAGLPSMFGFTVYSSIGEAESTGQIPFPAKGEKIIGGHAIVAAGYDEKLKIKNAVTPGALLIRNSWGTGWGDNGYGWLPYDYVLEGLAVDWWSLLKNEWIDTGNFKAKN